MSHRETAAQPWLRRMAALLVLASGLVHVGQVGVHLAEGWLIAGFFVVVGAAQVAAAGLLLRARPRTWLWFGIGGSAAVIAVWIVSRTLGFWFIQSGEPQSIGVADALAGLTEAWTIVVLGAYLAESTGRGRPTAVGVATSAVLGLTALWWLAAEGGAFNADPARLAIDQPWLVDWLIGIGGIGLAIGLLLAFAGSPTHWQRGLLRGLVGVVAVSAVALVWLTAPPTIGQNLDCGYAPVSTVLAGGHPENVEPITLDAGLRTFVPAFELRACGRSAVTILRVDPVTTVGRGATLRGVWLLPADMRLPDEGAASLPAGADAVPPAEIVPGQPRQLVVGLDPTGNGAFTLASLRLTYTADDTGEVTFASEIAICSGACGER